MHFSIRTQVPTVSCICKLSQFGEPMEGLTINSSAVGAPSLHHHKTANKPKWEEEDGQENTTAGKFVRQDSHLEEV